MLRRALCNNIVFRIEEDFLIADDTSLHIDVAIGFQGDILRTHQTCGFDLSRFGEDVFPVERACILQCVLGLDDDVLRRDETAAFGELETARILGIEDGVYGAFFLTVDFDLALFEPDHIRGERSDLLLGEGDAWGEVHLFGIGNARIHQCFECGFIVRIAVQMAFARLP